MFVRRKEKTPRQQPDLEFENRKSVPVTPAPVPKGKKARKRNPDQREMLLPIIGGATSRVERVEESRPSAIARAAASSGYLLTPAQVLEYLAREWEAHGAIDAVNMRHVYWALEAERSREQQPEPSTPAPLARRSWNVKTEPPLWIEPQLCKSVDQRPSGPEWIHELKLEGLRLAARIDHGDVQLLTRTGRERTFQFPSIVRALEQLPVETAYIDGVLTGVEDQGVYGPSALVYHAFDLLELDSAPIRRQRVLSRKERLASAVKGMPASVVYVDHDEGGETAAEWAYRRGLGIISKRTDAAYEPGNNGAWLESKIKAQ
jgi:hypothetical protein